MYYDDDDHSEDCAPYWRITPEQAYALAKTAAPEYLAGPFEVVLGKDKHPTKPKPYGSSDGGSTAYYDLPEGAVTLNDLIEAKGMSFAHGNIFKAAWRLGEKDNVSVAYDLRKIIYFAKRMLKSLGESTEDV